MLAAVVRRSSTGPRCRRRRRLDPARCCGDASSGIRRSRLRDIGDARMEIEDALKSPASRGRSGRRRAIGRPRRELRCRARRVRDVAFGVAAGTTQAEPWRRLSILPPPSASFFHRFRAGVRPFRPTADGWPISSARWHAARCRREPSLGAIFAGCRALNVTPDLRGAQSGSSLPFWSPDGPPHRLHAERDGKAIKTIAAIEVGALKLVTDFTQMRGAVWTSSNNWGLFADSRWPILQVWPARNAGAPLRRANHDDRRSARGGPPFPMLPDGDHFLFTVVTGGSVGPADRGKVVLQSVRTQEQRTIIGAGVLRARCRWAHRLCARRDALGAPVRPPAADDDGAALRVVGRQAGGQFGRPVRISDTGTLVYCPGRRRRLRPSWISRSSTRKVRSGC